MAFFVRFLAIACCAFILVSTTATAQMTTSTDDRVRRLERDISLMQRQLARSGSTASTRTLRSRDKSIPASADIELRLSSMEEAMRSLRGTIEENQYQVRKLSDNFAKFQKDVEYRLNERSTSATRSQRKEPLVKVTSAPPVTTTIAPRSENRTPFTQSSGQTTAGNGVLRTQTYQHPEYSSPRDLYNYAFRLLNQTKYPQSADAFGVFIKKYPGDPLIGNAHYWQGETYYIRRDYVNAADAFRQGFEVLPKGPKAPDNLLKLAMSLSALDRNKEACIVLSQITTKYRKQSTVVAEKAAKEKRRIVCK